MGLSIQHKPRWHTYWKNPGDSGLATTLSWQLAGGVQAGEIEWPTPQRLPFGPLMNYGYEGDVLLPVRLSIPEGFNERALEVKVRADWLVCNDVCIPESGDFTITVPAGAKIAAHAGLFAAALARVPRPVEDARVTAKVRGEALVIEADGLAPAVQKRELTLFAETPGVIDHAARIEQQWDGPRWTARVPLSPQRSERPGSMHVVLTSAGQAAGMQVRLAVEGPWPGNASLLPDAAGAADGPVPSATAKQSSLIFTLGLALLGGLLLNLMPCVFPVLSLKVLAFAQPGQSRKALAASGLAYTAGVVVSFVALAGLLLALRAGGEQLGWGFQLQSPAFVAVLAVIFTVMGLNLAGVFEFGSVLPSGLATLRARHPVADHALTGVLAVAVASPCTGPFMGVALGASLTLPTTQALLVFVALGVGMALPYLAVSLAPALARRLPRPGAWMLRFKVLMAFPMFATVVWLLWVLGQQVGIDGTAATLAVLVALAFGAWTVGSAGFGRNERLGFSAAALLLLGATMTWAWPSFTPPSGVAGKVQPESELRWQPWSAAAVASAQAQGRPVFVDFTAAWCVTCQVNKRTTLADPVVLAEFDRQGVKLLRADWTRRDPEITRELIRLGRSGVPVYALYRPTSPVPQLLSEILSTDEVLRALSESPVAGARERKPTVSTRSESQ
jgi:thiol:disulfide interchange protein DsbD